MDEQYDINTIDAHDFNTPRKNQQNSNSRKSINSIRRIGSNFEIPYLSQEPKSGYKNFQSLLNEIPQKSSQKDIKSTTFNVTPFQFYQKHNVRQSSHDFGSKIKDLSADNIALNHDSTNMQLQLQPLKQFSFSKENLDQFKSKETNTQQVLNESQINTQKKSPLGIPFQPFHHTRSGFKQKNNTEDGSGSPQNQNQILNSQFDSSLFSEQRSESQLGYLRNKSCFVQRDDNNGMLNKYDQQIFDINQTLKQIYQYKINLDQMQKEQKKRSKSQNIQSTKSDHKFKLPAIKQPVIYFSPLDQPSPKSQKKMKKAKKQKQQGMVSLAKQILNKMPQEKLANLMAINMYNQALMKKEINQEKITNVIEEQNKLLSKMLEQYEKKQLDTKKQIRNNFSKVEDEYDKQKFEKDKKNFEKVYSNIQKYNNENYMSKPLLTDSDLPDQIRNTKHLKRIHTHTQRYKQFIPSKISQPPMSAIEHDQKNNLAKEANSNALKHDDKLKFIEIEQQIKQFVQSLKYLQVENDQQGSQKIDTQSSLNKIGKVQDDCSDVKPIKRKVQLADLIKQDQNYQDKICLKEKPIAKNYQDKDVQLKDLIIKDKPLNMFMKELGQFIFIIIIQDVTFNLFAIQKDENYTDESQVDLNFLSQVKMQFQVIYQEQSHSEKLTCCDQTFYYPQFNEGASMSQEPMLCFLLGGDIGEIFVLKDVGTSFSISRRQVCTGQIQQIITPQENSFFYHENLCLVLSQLEHIYLVNFVNGLIVAQFGNQGSSGPGKYLSVSWHPSYEYFLSSRENGGIELWKIDQTIINHISEAYNTNKHPGKFFRKYVDMAYYYTLGVHINQTGPLVYSALMEHVLVSIDNNFVLRFTGLEIKNSESHINILTVELKLSPQEIVNVFSIDLDIFIVTKNRILVFTLNDSNPLLVDFRQIYYEPQNFNSLLVTKDYKYVIGMKEKQIYLNYQKGLSYKDYQIEVKQQMIN
ncbi:hypothetical protein ABPG72_000293 [Tetrahymena utriculariae]